MPGAFLYRARNRLGFIPVRSISCISCSARDPFENGWVCDSGAFCDVAGTVAFEVFGSDVFDDFAFIGFHPF